MGATYYVDPAAAGGDNDGSSWANAWTSLQTAADTAVAGDVVYCRGTQTLSGAAIDFDTNAGTYNGGWIKFIGCNASGAVDGTRFVVDADGGSHHAISVTSTAKMLWLENIEAQNTGAGTYHGFFMNQNDCPMMLNCCAHNCGGSGILLNLVPNGAFLFRCCAYSNTGSGFNIGNTMSTRMLFCSSRDNTAHGLYGSGVVIGCVLHGNTDDGCNGSLYGFCMNTVIDGNGDNGYEHGTPTGSYTSMVLACRITNHSGSGDIGMNCASRPMIVGYCYFEDNDGDNIQNATLHQFIPAEGGSTTSNLEDLANTDEGYVDKANHDFSTRYVDSGDPDLRRTAITIPWS